MKLFLSHRLYGKRPITHIDFYEVEQGYWRAEMASWSLEIECSWKRLRNILVLAAVAAPGIATAFGVDVPILHDLFYPDL